MWSMGGMGLIWILILVVVAVGIAALVKYLMSRK
ncbi:flagellar basal body-associated protein FliL [Constrictibacter sp. MBR-5]|jgi:flagellar basal body-associated protein FliL